MFVDCFFNVTIQNRITRTCCMISNVFVNDIKKQFWFLFSQWIIAVREHSTAFSALEMSVAHSRCIIAWRFLGRHFFTHSIQLHGSCITTCWMTLYNKAQRLDKLCTFMAGCCCHFLWCWIFVCEWTFIDCLRLIHPIEWCNVLLELSLDCYLSLHWSSGTEYWLMDSVLALRSQSHFTMIIFGCQNQRPHSFFETAHFL